MKKRIMIVLLVLVVSVTMLGCSDSSSSSDETTETEVTSEIASNVEDSGEVFLGRLNQSIEEDYDLDSVKEVLTDDAKIVTDWDLIIKVDPAEKMEKEIFEDYTYGQELEYEYEFLDGLDESEFADEEMVTEVNFDLTTNEDDYDDDNFNFNEIIFNQEFTFFFELWFEYLEDIEESDEDLEIEVDIDTKDFSGDTAILRGQLTETYIVDGEEITYEDDITIELKEIDSDWLINEFIIEGEYEENLVDWY
ncbi:hypothetical protein [Fuchsiella alkaliacetigena]|uniref:hypothetical protein n=1 Tax=Fuchsiella alkaliacetigena TaxID=957042 RepID=UPI00200AFE50|nr:hypothetical protein [Fuchsiella alkaliacetigena]MCK8825833.1 hypothetical protein [Fuchsiella alkaliacetigena]